MSQLKWIVIYPSSDSRRETLFVHNPSQMVADDKGIFRSVLRKKFKKNSDQVGQNFENQLPDNLSGIKNRLPTKLVGSKKFLYAFIFFEP